MLEAEKRVFSCLDALEIKHSTVAHPPIFTEHDGVEWLDIIPGLHTKNLFLHDKGGGLWLVVMPLDQKAQLGNIARQVGTTRLSFANGDLLFEALGITPGSVTPFALLNDTDRKVRVIVDEHILESAEVNFHPLHNAASTTIASSDLLKFMRSLGYEPMVINCCRDHVASLVATAIIGSNPS